MQMDPSYEWAWFGWNDIYRLNDQLSYKPNCPIDIPCSFTPTI
jgi:hypothetical protein